MQNVVFSSGQNRNHSAARLEPFRPGSTAAFLSSLQVPRDNPNVAKDADFYNNFSDGPRPSRGKRTVSVIFWREMVIYRLLNAPGAYHELCLLPAGHIGGQGLFYPIKDHSYPSTYPSTYLFESALGALQLNSVKWSHLWAEIGERDANAFGETPKCDYKRLNISNFQPRFCSSHPCTGSSSASLGLDLTTTPVCSRLSASSAVSSHNLTSCKAGSPTALSQRRSPPLPLEITGRFTT